MLTPHTFTRRTGLKTLAAAALLSAGMGSALAQDNYPSKPIDSSAHNQVHHHISSKWNDLKMKHSY